MLTLLMVGFVYGALAAERDWFPHNVIKSAYKSMVSQPGDRPAGRWGRAQSTIDNPGVTDFSGLNGLGYIAGYEPAPDQTGVVVHHRELAANGYNFFSSGHAPAAFLLDMDGAILHSWSRTFDEVWPNRPTKGGYETYFRRCHLYSNGDILAIFDQLGLVRLDRDSNVVWSLSEPVHHDVDVDDQGLIHLLAHYRRERPEVRDGVSVLDDHIVVVSDDGKILKRVSLIDAFQQVGVHLHLEQRDPWPVGLVDGDANVHHVRELLDEVFGASRLVGFSGGALGH